ncbi:MAG: hypothetical protein HFH84_14625 [Lachnospiraceae bacterium]|jgi:hypothetical protein|nr:hypothetical protein [Lachnospiraceae bacterium]
MDESGGRCGIHEGFHKENQGKGGAAQLLAAQKIRTVDEYVAKQEEMGGAAEGTEPIHAQREEASGEEAAGRKISETEAPEARTSGTKAFMKEVPEWGYIGEETGKPEKETEIHTGKILKYGVVREDL